MKKPRMAIGMTVLSMGGRLKNNHCSYWDVRNILDSWEQNKVYWATKKNYAFMLKNTMFGETKSEIVERWLIKGYGLEKKFKNLVKSLEHRAIQ